MQLGLKLTSKPLDAELWVLNLKQDGPMKSERGGSCPSVFPVDMVCCRLRIWILKFRIWPLGLEVQGLLEVWD